MLISEFNSRRQRAQDKRQRLLRFLREETWSNAAIVGQVLGLRLPATLKTLRQAERDGMVIRYVPAMLRTDLWGITPQGLAFSWVEGEIAIVAPHFEPGKLAELAVPHRLAVQRARLRAQSAGWVNWMPGERLPGNPKKRPDALACDPAGRPVAIEVERTIKTLKRYQSIFSAYLPAIKRGEFVAVHYVCPDAEFAPRLRRMFGLVQKVPFAGEQVPITDRHRARFPVFALEDWPPSAGALENSDGK